MTAHRSENSPSIDAALGNPDLADEQRSLLDLIDKLQYAQLGNVKLPQIAVVGDQSAGKSSVLEAITGIPFQRAAGACTRFATKIQLRRWHKEEFSIHIIPDKKSRSPTEQERLKRFGDNIDESMSFYDLMNLAIDQIAPKNIPGRFAAEDILVVEKRGPNMPLLTVIDLPGLVRNPNNDQSEDDIKAINDLTDRYMKNTRTIILAVIGGNQDYVQAPVLTKARKFDPTGARTIGVLTKPDLTDSIGLEDKFIALVNNKDKHYHFTLGWYVLLNPGPQESPSAEERKRTEDAFFATGKWGELPMEMCGATELKRKLSVQLQRHIGKHIRKLQKEIQKEHDDCVKELKSLGTGKDTIEEMKVELVQLCSDSKELVSSAVYGTYINPHGKSFFRTSKDPAGTPLQKLRARAVEENKRFADRVRMHGEKFHFVSSGAEATTGKKSGITKEHFTRDHVKELLRQNTGTELPLDHNPRLVYTLFQDNSENWSTLAQDHKNELGLICGEFLGEVIDYVWPSGMREPLRTLFLDPQMEDILEKAQRVVDALIQDLQSEIRPYDPEYETRLRVWREGAPAGHPYSEAEELLEKMLIYYELAAKTFISNVITQVVERHLLLGLLKIFDSVKIFTMENKRVEAIAAEDEVTRYQRVTLKAKKAAIEEARNRCNNLAMRKELKSYSKDGPDDEEEGSDEEESGPTLLTKKLHKSPETDRLAGSSASPPVPSQVPTSRDERRQITPTKPDSVPNSNVGPSPGSGSGSAFDFVSRLASIGPSPDALMDQPNVPGSWNNQTANNYYTPATNAPPPQHPPPPVPPSRRPEKSRHSAENQHYPPLQPDSISHQQFPVQEQLPRTEINGHNQYKNPFTQYDVNGSGSTYFDANNNYPQSPTKHKLTRKLLGTAKA